MVRTRFTRVGKSRPAITNTLRLLDAPEEIRDAVVNDTISAGHARALLSISDPERQQSLLKRIIAEGLSVRQAEKLAKQPAEPTSGTRIPRIVSPEERAVESELRPHLGTKVELKRGKRGGTIVVHWYSDEELNAILTRVFQERDEII